MRKNAISTRVLAALSAGALVSTVITVGATSTANAATPKTGGTLYLLDKDPRFDHYDPSRIYTGRDLAFMNSFHTRTLVAYNPVPGLKGTNLVPDLATNTGVPSNQAKTWKFTLRPGGTFEDGKAITCEDIKYGASRVFATDVINDGPAYLQQWLDIPKNTDGESIFTGPYKNTPAGVAAYNKAVTCKGSTITFNLNKSIADFNYLATYGVISPVQKKLDTGDKYDLNPQATGPYKIVENSATQLRLVRNTKWKKSSDPVRTPYPDEVIVQFGIDQQVRDELMLEDSIPNAMNFGSPLPANLDKFFKDAKFANRRMNNPSPYVDYLAFNLAKMPCLEIRQAMYYAWDAQAILNYNGGAEYAGAYVTSIISPLLATDFEATKIVGPSDYTNVTDVEDPITGFKPSGNVTKAKALMDTAKTKCPADYTKATETGITIDVRASSTLNDTIPINEKAWARAGIKVNFNIIKSGYYPTIMNADKQSDMSFSGWGADWANASTVIPELFTTAGGFNISQNSKDAAYKAFEDKSNLAMKTTDRKKQAALWKELDKEAMKAFWVLPTIAGKAQKVWGSALSNVFFWVPQGYPAFGKIWVNQ